MGNDLLTPSYCVRITGSVEDDDSSMPNVCMWFTNRERGMTFEVTPPCTAEPNGAVERYGGYINDIQRTMVIDISLPDKENLWPFAVETAIYTTNRLVNPKTGISPLTHWRQETGAQH
ncbi:hypothetical protein N7501_008136 [Penicillium viridicatum]|nr:hypothetical protein N7501_008136 [Penicillium viridicatum]